MTNRIYFTHVNKEYVTDDNQIVDIDTLMKHPHEIKGSRGWYDSSITRNIEPVIHEGQLSFIDLEV